MTLDHDVLFDIETYADRSGTPYPTIQLTAGTYGDDRYRAVKRLERDGRVRIVHDRWGWSYVSTLRASISIGREVHGLPHEVQGSADHALRWETGEREQHCAYLENTYADGYPGYLERYLAGISSRARCDNARRSDGCIYCDGRPHDRRASHFARTAREVAA